MIEGALLPDRPSAAVDANEWAFHHRLLFRLVLATPGATTEEVQLCYDVVAPLAYEGTLASPVASRRHRRKLLGDLADEGLVAEHESPRGRVWLPVKTPEELLARAPTAQAAREAAVTATRTDGGEDGRG